jgi:catechol 2,3-dioxygenase-like lactoylglutathione lyase family enzyme
MLDHVGLAVSDFAWSKSFFERALAPLGYKCLMEFTGVAGFGREAKPDFWITQGNNKSNPTHVAFAAPERSVVDSFHEAATGARGKDNGKPGLRTEYHPTYYGAFVLDPDSNTSRRFATRGKRT